MPSEPICGAEHADGAQRGKGDVETGLGDEAASAIEHADQRRVEAVNEKNTREDAKRQKDVRRVLELGGERREYEEQRRHTRRQHRVNPERVALRLFFLTAGGARYSSRNALNRGRGNDVVRNVGHGQDGRERTVAIHTDEPWQEGLLNQADEDEPDLGSGDREPSAPGAPRRVGVALFD